VATGLAWTSVGGEILFIEADSHVCTGKLQLNRSAGRRDERVSAGALSYVRTKFGALWDSARLP